MLVELTQNRATEKKLMSHSENGLLWVATEYDITNCEEWNQELIKVVNPLYTFYLTDVAKSECFSSS